MAATHIQHIFNVIKTALQQLVKQVDINIAVGMLKFVLHERGGVLQKQISNNDKDAKINCIGC